MVRCTTCTGSCAAAHQGSVRTRVHSERLRTHSDHQALDGEFEFLFPNRGCQTPEVWDESLIQRRLAELLEQEGLEVQIARNGMAALAKCIKHAPDLVLSDIEMPSMNGWSLLRAIRARPSLTGLPFVFLTSSDSEKDRLQGCRLGADDFISKTVSGPEIAARVERVCSARLSDESSS